MFKKIKDIFHKPFLVYVCRVEGFTVIIFLSFVLLFSEYKKQSFTISFKQDISHMWGLNS